MLQVSVFSYKAIIRQKYKKVKENYLGIKM